MQQDFLRQSKAVTSFQIVTRSMSEQCCVFFCVIICELLEQCRACRACGTRYTTVRSYLRMEGTYHGEGKDRGTYGTEVLPFLP